VITVFAGSRVGARGLARRSVVRVGFVLGLFGLVSNSAAQAAYVQVLPGTASRVWSPPGGVQSSVRVPVSQVGPGDAGAARTRAVAGAQVVPSKSTPVSWPSGSAQVGLVRAVSAGSGPRAALRLGASVRAGSLPVSIAGADASSGAVRSVSVSLASHSEAAAAGVNGVILSMMRGDGGASASSAEVSLDYSSFAAAYGGGFGDRLNLVELPACALTTPQVAKCRVQIPVTFTNDRSARTLNARVSLGAGGVIAASPGSSSRSSAAGVAAGAMVLAATSSGAGSAGTYTATSLSQAGSWTSGGSSGAFTYSYPVALPPSTGGKAPSVTLSYDSSSVDGRTSAKSAQASWIGDGWDYSPGYVERSYLPCSQDGIANSADLCWGGNVVTLSLNGQNEALVRDDASPNGWRLQNDDGALVVPLTGQNNNAYAGEGWEIVEPDGTQYYFGANPDGLDASLASASTWTEPVYCPKSGDGPSGNSCYNSTSKSGSFAAAMSWRWNLDYVVDPHGNLTSYTWVPETNYYDRGYGQGNGSGTNTLYTRGGYLSKIGYGYRVSDAVAGTQPTDTVSFNVNERCTPVVSGFTSSECTYAYLSSNLSKLSVTENWLDTPTDQICPTLQGSCAVYSPAFFTTKQLASISTAVRSGSGYQSIDTYTLSQYFPSPQAGVVVDPTKSYDSPGNPGDGSAAVLWLQSIQRTGTDVIGGGGSVAQPVTVFVPDLMPNRMNGTSTGYVALYRPRIDQVLTSSGEQITVAYTLPGCSSTSLPAPDANTGLCFPQYWTPPGGSGAVLDWFNTYQVQKVTQADLVGPAAWSENEVTSYAYQSAAWHRDDSPMTPNSQRTWNVFHGFGKVTTTVGTALADAVPTQSVSLYLQGMNGDYLANGSQRSVCVQDNVAGDPCVTDQPQLQGQLLESDTLNGVGGAVQERTVDGPWTYRQTASQAQSSVGSPATVLPTLTAQMPASSRVRTFALWHDGTWKVQATADTYDSSGRLSTSDETGDGVTEVCTSTTYATSTSSNANMLNYPSEVTAVNGPCGTAMSSATAVSDARMFYDGSSTSGALTAAGDVTQVQEAVSYDSSGNPVLKKIAQTGYDAYGRVTASTDANGVAGTISYSALGASPDVVTASVVVNASTSWPATTTLDPGRGVTLASTDVNGKLTSYTYDGLGEVTGVWSPLHSKAAGATADETFAYSETGTAPSTVSTTKLLDGGGYTDSTTVDIYDGQLRLIQSQAPTATGDPGRTESNTHYNSLGQAVKVSSTYIPKDTAYPSGTVDVPVNDTMVPMQTESAYDGMGRAVRALTVAFGVNQYSTTTSYPGVDQTDVTPPSGGTATSTFTDVLGRTVASWNYKTAAPTDKPGDAVATGYKYTPGGQQASITDAAGNQWTYTYNLFGQQISATDPGSGSTSATYTPGGLVLTSTDANGTMLTYAYDTLGRVAAQYNTTGNVLPSSTNQLAAWTYDTLQKDKLTSVTTYTNPTSGANDPNSTYTEATTGYNALYQPTGQSVTIPSNTTTGALAGTYQVGYTYSSATNSPTAGTSLLKVVVYGADGGLPAEKFKMAYSNTGSALLDAYAGVNGLSMNTATYDDLGQVTSTNFGAYTSQLDRTETYDQATGRLLTLSDQLQPLSSTLDDTTYTYNQAGRVTAESDTQNGSSTPDTQCFSYDNLGQLTTAFTSTDPVTASTASTTPGGAQISGVGSCNDTAPVAGKVTGGPAPYWESYQYSLLGDRVQQVNHDTSVTSSANTATQTLTYNGYAPATGTTTAAASPDQTQAVTTTGPTGTTTSNYSYFSNGAVKTRSGQAFTYTPTGQTATVTNTTANTTSTYTYDATGSLLLQSDPAADQSILYLPWGEQLTLSTGNGQVSGLRYYDESPDGLDVVRSSTGALTYEATSPQGTATIQVDATTLAFTDRYYDPFGNLRGTPPSSWPDQHSYLGKPQDPSTGLDLLGAREYDPATGRFLSVDPILETGDQRQMNGYTYSANDPVNGSDPTGTMLASGDGDVGAPARTCGNGVYADSCSPDTANGDPNGPAPNQYWYDQSQGQYADGCINRACITNNDKHANDPGYWSTLADIAANRAAIANNIAAAQQFQAEQDQAHACHGWWHCAWHAVDHAAEAVDHAVERVNEDIGKALAVGISVVSWIAPVLDVLALIPVLTPIFAPLAAAATLISTIAAAGTLITDFTTPGASFGKKLLDSGGLLASAFGYGVLAKADIAETAAAKSLQAGSDALRSGNPLVKTTDAMVARMGSYGAARGSMGAALLTASQMSGINDAASWVSDIDYGDGNGNDSLPW